MNPFQCKDAGVARIQGTVRDCLICENVGAPGTTRTCDPLIRSQVLYPAELRVRERQFKVSSFRFQVREVPAGVLI